MPAGGARGVSVSQSVSATFNEDIYELSVDHTSFAVLTATAPMFPGRSRARDGQSPSGPIIDLASAQTYTEVITASVVDYALNAMNVQFEWSFCTAPGYVPDMVLVEEALLTMGDNSTRREY